MLATFDPLAAMAEPDEAQLESLLVGIETDSEALAARIDWRHPSNWRRWRHWQVAITRPPVRRIFRQGIADDSGEKTGEARERTVGNVSGPASAETGDRNAQMN